MTFQPKQTDANCLAQEFHTLYDGIDNNAFCSEDILEEEIFPWGNEVIRGVTSSTKTPTMCQTISSNPNSIPNSRSNYCWSQWHDSLKQSSTINRFPNPLRRSWSGKIFSRPRQYPTITEGEKQSELNIAIPTTIDGASNADLSALRTKAHAFPAINSVQFKAVAEGGGALGGVTVQSRIQNGSDMIVSDSAGETALHIGSGTIQVPVCSDIRFGNVLSVLVNNHVAGELDVSAQDEILMKKIVNDDNTDSKLSDGYNVALKSVEPVEARNETQGVSNTDEIAPNCPNEINTYDMTFRMVPLQPPLQHRRRRERRRHNRRDNNSRYRGRSGPVRSSSIRQGSSIPSSDRLPDILNSHLPPPYSTLPHETERSAAIGWSPLTPVTPVMPLPVINREYIPHRRFGTTRQNPNGEDEPKSCCGMMVTQTISIRWFIIMIAFVGLCCAVVGTILGALKATGREHLWSSLLMTGVGIVLITVSGIAWRLTSQDAPSCRVMLGLRREDCNSGNSRPFSSNGTAIIRPHHPYSTMLCPEFHSRPPPPSYQASMQEYRLRLLLLDRQPPAVAHGTIPLPPPFYRSQPQFRSGLLTLSRDANESQPPSYRSRVPPSSAVPPAVLTSFRIFSINAYLQSTVFDSELQTNTGQQQSSNSKVDLEQSVSSETEAKVSSTGSSKCNQEKSGNFVTVVQTTNSEEVISQDPIIVTIGCSSSEPNSEIGVIARI